MGLGFAVAFKIALKGARVYISARNLEKANRAIEEMRRQAGNFGNLNLEPLAMDLCSFEEVRNAAQIVKQKEVKLDILVNNAAM
jgi:NAD(P)-dependent dehydrogenase (short-subunit alcohol dehydrogenase family)